MKKIYLLFVIQGLFFNLHLSFGQAGEWVWLHGNNTFGSTGNFGVQGMPSPSNDPPALYEACEWTDLNGNFWMYGGLDNRAGFSVHNDLWKYDPLANEWTWVNGTQSINDSGYFGVQGIASPSNHPPSLAWGVASWVDLNGYLWMFGGCFNGSASSSQSNLWRYEISTNEWTWMKGPGINVSTGSYGTQGVPDTASYPGGRSECSATWVDNAGDLWMFGGYIGQIYNDMWRYNIATNTWTWMKGSNLRSQQGYWGTKGVEDPANTPSARWAYTRWKDECGNLWLFGGSGFDAVGAFWQINDLWRYNIATNNWTWMSGINIGSSTNTGVFGKKCITSPGNVPPPRGECRTAWTDQKGDFWMFGGSYVYGLFNPTFMLNDLWKYCVSSNQWTWESGDTTNANSPASGNWGTMGVPAASNKPNGRNGALAWTDHKGHLYLFGGACPFGTEYNDVWKYTIDSACGTTCSAITPCALVPAAGFTTDKTAICSNDCIDFTDLSTGATSWKWIFQGANPSSSTLENPQGVCYLNSGNYDVTLIAYNIGGSDTLTITKYINVLAAPPTPVITQVGATLYCSTDPTYTAYQWFSDTALIPGATDTSLVITHSGNYNVQVSNVNGCKIAVGINVVLGLQDYWNDKSIALSPNPTGDKLRIHLVSNTGRIEKIEIHNILGQQILQPEVIPLQSGQSEIDVSLLTPGIYFIRITNDKERWVGKFVKE